MSVSEKEGYVLYVPATDSVTKENGINGETPEQIQQFVLEEKQTKDDAYHNKRCPCIQKPEGKNAWLAAVFCACITFCLAIEIGCFGIYYQEYVYMFNASTAAVGWIKGIQTMAGASVGLVSGVFIKVYGARLMGCMGGLFISVGYLGAALSPNIYVSYLTHGAITGIGSNIILTTVLVCIQQHFTRNKVLGSGISFLGFDIGAFASPIIISKLIEIFGTRGALLIQSAIFAHMILFALMIRPPKMKKIQKGEDKVPISDQLKNELCEFSLLEDGLFLWVLFTGFCAWYTTFAFISHVVSRAMFLGVPRANAAMLQASGGCFNAIGRVVSTLVANTKRVNVTVYYGFTLLLVGFGPLVYGFLTSYNTMFIASLLFGVGMGSSTTVHVVVLVQMFAIERLPRAIGLYNVPSHLGMTLGAPISGLIFDYTQNYDIPFFLSGALAILSGLVIFVVAVFDRRRQRQRQRQQQKA